MGGVCYESQPNGCYKRGSLIVFNLAHSIKNEGGHFSITGNTIDNRFSCDTEGNTTVKRLSYDTTDETDEESLLQVCQPMGKDPKPHQPEEKNESLFEKVSKAGSKALDRVFEALEGFDA